jgi:hypothetical protein
MEMTRSKAIIAALHLVDSRVQSKGFARRLSALSDSRHFRAATRGVLPDGFVVNEDAAQVVVYEVADTNPIRPGKAVRLAELADELDEIGWALLVVVMDYTGHVVAEVPGWAYEPAYTEAYAPPNCLDMTPAARTAADLLA